jgi:hypothetical protein
MRIMLDLPQELERELSLEAAQLGLLWCSPLSRPFFGQHKLGSGAAPWIFSPRQVG